MQRRGIISCREPDRPQTPKRPKGVPRKRPTHNDQRPTISSARKPAIRSPTSDRRERPLSESVPDQLQRLVRPTCRTRHLSRHTAKTYWGWIKRFVVFHDLQDPSRLNAADVNAFLWHLAVDRNVAASTQDQAKNAVVFLDRDVLDIRLGDFGDITKANRPKRLPVVLSRSEALTILALLDGTAALACGLLYGSGLRVDECVSLRIQDLAPASLTVNVRRGKGAKDRVTILPVRG